MQTNHSQNQINMDKTEDCLASCQIKSWKKNFCLVKWNIFHLEENVSFVSVTFLRETKGFWLKAEVNFKVINLRCYIDINWSTKVIEWMSWFVIVGIIKIHKV